MGRDYRGYGTFKDNREEMDERRTMTECGCVLLEKKRVARWTTPKLFPSLCFCTWRAKYSFSNYAMCRIGWRIILLLDMFGFHGLVLWSSWALPVTVYRFRFSVFGFQKTGS